jgi:hypothetical protein
LQKLDMLRIDIFQGHSYFLQMTSQTWSNILLFGVDTYISKKEISCCIPCSILNVIDMFWYVWIRRLHFPNVIDMSVFRNSMSDRRFITITNAIAFAMDNWVGSNILNNSSLKNKVLFSGKYWLGAFAQFRL